MLWLYAIFELILSPHQRKNLPVIFIKITILSRFDQNYELYLNGFMVDFVESIGNMYLTFSILYKLTKLAVLFIHKESFTYQQIVLLSKLN